MQVDGHVQRLGGFEHRRELRFVQVVPMRVAVDDDRAEAQLPYRAFHFLDGIGRVMRRECGHAGEARGILATRFGQLVVGIDGQRAGRGRVEHLHARGGDPDDLAVDAGGVHVGDAPGADVLQSFVDDLARGLWCVP